jgi:hypothetical protein
MRPVHVWTDDSRSLDAGSGLTAESHALIVVGIIMILAGPLIMFYGQRRKPVRGGVVLRIFEKRPRSENGSLFGLLHKDMFGAGVLFAGIWVLLKALNAL